MSVQRSIRVADTFYIGELIVVEVRLGPLRRAEMDKDRLDAARMNFLTNFRDVIQGLPAKRASKVTKEDQQGWRHVDKLKQRSTRFCLKLPKDAGNIRLRGGLHDRSHPSSSLVPGCDCSSSSLTPSNIDTVAVELTVFYLEPITRMRATNALP
jgi:hypothetical protein